MSSKAFNHNGFTISKTSPRLLIKCKGEHYIAEYQPISTEHPLVYIIKEKKIDVDEFASKMHEHPVVYTDKSLDFQSSNGDVYHIIRFENGKIKRLNAKETMFFQSFLFPRKTLVLSDIKLSLYVN